MDDLIDIKARFIAPTVIYYTKLVFKMIIMDDEGDSNSVLTTLNDLNSQEPPGGQSIIPDPSFSSLEDRIVQPGV